MCHPALLWFLGVLGVWLSSLDLASQTADPLAHMEDKHTYPEALETLVARLPELELVLGPQAKHGLGAVQSSLQQAIAARANGDVPGAVAKISTAMETLSRLADGLGPQEAMMMRMLTDQFRQALLSGQDGEARRVSEVMREKSGATIRRRT